MPERTMRGFSVLEMMIVVAIVIIMGSITFISLQPALRDAQVNAAYDMALSQIRMRVSERLKSESNTSSASVMQLPWELQPLWARPTYAPFSYSAGTLEQP